MRWQRAALIDTATAIILALALGAAWSWRDWADLSQLRLPDADDMMRLQQIRDWLGGQAWSDLAQHRLGIGGVGLHWSRLGDLVPGALIEGLTPMLGRHAAEVATVIVWPTLLLAGALYLVAGIARATGGEDTARPAVIVAAIAFPATTLFAPGRIDHHALQMVLLLLVTHALVGRATFLNGLGIGFATCLSIVVGLETVPLLAVAASIPLVQWIVGRASDRDRLMGLGIALATGLIGASLFFRSGGWSYPACDGFDAISWRAGLTAAACPIGFVLSGWTFGARGRLITAIVGGSAAIAIMWFTTPECLDPYGGVAPVLRRLWLDHVAEAQSAVAATPVIAIGFCGLAVAGAIASAWLLWTTRERRWAMLLALQVTSLLLAVMQLRGIYSGALLAAPALAAIIVTARRRGVIPVVGAWLASAGLAYPLAASALSPQPASDREADCATGDLLAVLARLPAGTVMAPIDTGGPAIALTPHRLIAGAYHRNGPANLAMYRFFLGSPDQARAIAARLGVRYVVACDGFAGLTPRPERNGDRLIGRLMAAKPPAWLDPVTNVASGARIFRVVDLSPATRAP